MVCDIFKICSKVSLTVETYIPEKPNGKALIFYYGGGWMSDNRSRFGEFAKELTENGYIVFLPQYRVYNLHGVFPKDGLEDVADGILFIYNTLLERYQISSKAVSWAGASAGGYMVLCAALLEPYRSRIGFSPEKIVVFSTVCRPDSMVSRVKEKCGADFDFHGICPVKDLKNAGPAILAMHGTEDEVASFNDLKSFAKRYEELGGVCQIRSYERGNHGFWRSSDSDYRDTFANMIRCLSDKELGNDSENRREKEDCK